MAIVGGSEITVHIYINMGYIKIDNKKIYVRIIVRHNTSRTYVTIDDETKQEYIISFDDLKYDDNGS